MIRIVIDTSVLIDYTRAGVGDLPLVIKAASNGEAELFIPTIIVLELWSGRSMMAAKNQKQAEKLLRPMKRIELTEAVARQAGVLLREGRISDGFDAVVAASALEAGAYLATANRRHFSKVRGLELFDASKVSGR